MLRSNASIRLIQRIRLPTTVPTRHKSRTNRLTQKFKQLNLEKLKVSADVGPLYQLIERDTVNNGLPDSSGNALHSLRNYHNENLFRKNIQVAAHITKLRKKLERHENVTNEDYYGLINLVKKNEFTTGKFYNMVLVDLPMYMVEFNDDELVDVQILETVSNLLTNSKYFSKVDFRTMINYSIMIEKLHELRYFEELTPKLVLQIVYIPFLRTLEREQYVLRSNNLTNALNFIDHYKDQSFHGDLMKIIRPDIIRSLQLAIDLDDHEVIDKLFNIYKDNFEFLSNEDFQTLLSSTLESGNTIMLDNLIHNWNFKNSFPKISEAAKRQIALLFLQTENYKSFNRFFKLSPECTVFERALVLQQFVDSLSIHDFLKLVDVTILEGEELVLRDFEYLTWKITSISGENKVTFAGIENTLNQEVLESKELSNNVKTLYINAFLKSLSLKTNASGVIHGYCQLPLELLNRETYQILFHAFSATSPTAKRTAPLFKFASDVLKFNFTTQEYNILISNAVDTKSDIIQIHQIYYYLYQYMKRNNTDKIPPRIAQIFETIPGVIKSQKGLNLFKPVEQLVRKQSNAVALLLLANKKKYIMTPLEIIEMAVRRIGSAKLQEPGEDPYSKSPEDYYFEDYEPIDYPTFDYYDHMDAKKIKLKHLAFIEDLKDKGRDLKFIEERSARLQKEIEQNESALVTQAISAESDTVDVSTNASDLFADDKIQ